MCGQGGYGGLGSALDANIDEDWEGGSGEDCGGDREENGKDGDRDGGEGTARAQSVVEIGEGVVGMDVAEK